MNNQSTSYWIQEVKRITIELGNAQKIRIKYAHLLEKTLEGTAQYRDIQTQIGLLDDSIFNYKKDLLAIKCAALSSCQNLSKSAKKVGFVTNAAYRDYIIEEFVHDNLSHYEGWTKESVVSDLFSSLYYHLQNAKEKGLYEMETRIQRRYVKGKGFEYRDPKSATGVWISSEEYDKELERLRNAKHSMVKNFDMVMDVEVANKVEGKTR